MKSFSVLTVSRREGWQKAAVQSIGRQTVTPQEWIVVLESKPFVGWKYIRPGIPGMITRTLTAPLHTRVSNLNASLNYGLRYISAEYVIFYQDFIELQSDCFGKLLTLAAPDTFVTTCAPNYDGSNDGRFTGLNKPRPCRAGEWEANVAIAPMSIINELGGFDEDYDNGWSWDNVNLAERAEMLGCKFIIDESNRPKLFPHEVNDNDAVKPNGDLHAQTMEAIRKGEKPLRLDYLRAGNGTYRG